MRRNLWIASSLKRVSTSSELKGKKVAMPVANLPDVKLYYEWNGAEHLPVLVLSNSLGTNLHMWDSQIEAFSQHFRILRLDTRGHGQSSVTPGPYTIEHLSWDVVHLMDALRIERAYFCGLSMGGAIGMFLGTKAANRFHKMILSSTAAKIGTADSWATRIQTVQKGGMRSVVDTVLGRWFTESFRTAHPTEVQGVRAMLEATSPDGYIANCAAVRDSDQRDTVGNIKVPCLVVVGSADPGTPPMEARFLQKTIPGAELVELPGSHLCNIESKNQFNQHVLQFLLA
jgi:3-oxoadipate enol-lactonase